MNIYTSFSCKKVFRALVLLGAMSAVWLWKSASPARAIATDIWQELAPAGRWTITEQEVTGRSEFINDRHFLVTRLEKVPELIDFQFRFRLHPLQGVDHNIIWNFQNTSNYYQAHFSSSGVTVSRFVNGQQVLSRFAHISISNSQTYDVSLTQQGSQLTLRVDGQKLLDFQDLTHNNQSRGAVGFKMSAGTVVPAETKFSQIVIEDFAVKSLPVQSLKQTDSAWSGLVYDTAPLWSDEPTIGRWGCALTSLVMILHYHQLVTMTDGRMVTPATVNEWLLAQPDGYVGQGLVNWFAAQRLSREIAESYTGSGSPRPKLEFSYFGSEGWQAKAVEEIRANRPPIVQVPGHFAALHGFDLRANDFFIRDPFFAYTKTSQHPRVESLRLFHPSQTDQSALVVVHDPAQAVEIRSSAGEVLSVSWDEQLVAGAQPSPTARFTAVFKPEDGEYEIVVGGESPSGVVRLFAYDQQAQLTEFTIAGTTRLSYSKTGESELVAPSEPEPTPEPTPELTPEPTPSPEPLFSWQEFLDALTATHTLQHLTDAQFTRLSALVGWASEADEATWSRYKNYLTTILEISKNEANGAALQVLQALLE